MNRYAEKLAGTVGVAEHREVPVGISTEFPFRANQAIEELARADETQIVSIVCGGRKRGVAETLNLVQGLLLRDQKLFLTFSFPGRATDPADIAALENLLLFRDINGKVISDKVKMFVVCRDAHDGGFLETHGITAEFCEL